ncbi:MAG: AAA family ATPase [Syntrophales bacterium]
MKFKDVADARDRLTEAGYIASKEIATVVFLAAVTNRPILVEGPAGVGKTELAKAAARALERRLIRLQCYEGLDESKALYDWEYSKQLLYTQMLKEKIQDVIAGTQTLPEAVERIAGQENAFFSERFLQSRPLLQAITSEDPVVLLIDEVDKSDPEFEAFLLEVLSDFQVSIPELGTRTARNIPFVVLTSNNVREMSDTLKRRCLHLYIDYPDMERERRIVEVKFPGIRRDFAEKIVAAVRDLRSLDLKKKPCVSETLDWTRALMALDIEDVTPEVVLDTLNVLCKCRPDMEAVRRHLGESPREGAR